MKKFTKNKKSREILALHIEFLKSYLTGRAEKDETLLGFLDNVAAQELGEFLDEGTPEQTIAVRRLTDTLRRYRRETHKPSQVTSQVAGAASSDPVL